MIQAEIVSFQQITQYEDGGFVTLAKMHVKLPDGTVIEADVPPQHLERLLAYTNMSAPMAAPKAVAAQTMVAAPAVQEPSADLDPAEEPQEEMQEESQEEQEALDTTPVKWMEIPEQLLDMRTKYAMMALNLPEILPVSNVAQIKEALLREYSEADWAMVELKMRSSQEPQAQSPPKKKPKQLEHPPKPPGVEWGEGAAMRPSVPSRTVPKDDRGYPIVSRKGNEVDPGEVAPNPDDDGIEQF